MYSATQNLIFLFLGLALLGLGLATGAVLIIIVELRRLPKKIQGYRRWHGRGKGLK